MASKEIVVRHPGALSKYRAEFAKQAEKLCLLGATKANLADFFGVSTNTIWGWQTTYEEFSRAVRVGKDAFDDRAEPRKAAGYSFDAVKIFCNTKTGKVLREEYREHLPPGS